MPSKFAQQYRARDRSTTSNSPNTYVPPQPSILAAAEIPYRVGHTRPAPKSTSSSTATASTSNNAPFPPYRQRLVATALAPTEDPASSNDSSSAPSSNALSSGLGSSSFTSSSSSKQSAPKGKGRGTSPNILPAPRISPSPSSISAPTSDRPEFDPNTSYFEHLMEHNASAMASPGPWYFEQRRMLWKTEPPNPPRPASPSPSRVKLEALLSQAGAVESEEVWRAGLKNVWKGIVGGNQLRKRLPLDIVLKILQAGWLRDGTWPKGMAAPEWEQQSPPPPPLPPPPDGSSNTRYYHEQEAYAAALHARAAAEQASGSAQMMYMQAYAMMGMTGIPPGYSPSSGDMPEEGGYYFMPYGYAETTPPLPEGEAEGQQEGMENAEGPPPTPVNPAPELESEMDTEDEVEEYDAAVGGLMEGVVKTGDGRYEER